MRYGCGLLVALICACGGGGTAPANGGPSAAQQLAQEAIESCGATFHGDFAQLLSMVEGLFDPAETNPQQFTIDGVDTDTASVNWSLDLDGDTMPDLVGGLLFANEMGEPEAAADVNLLAAGFDDLDTMVATLPDGTVVSFGAAAVQPPITDVTFTFVITGGAVDVVSGLGLFQDVDCLVNVEFADVPFQNVGGEYPDLTATLDLAAAEGAVQGTITFNGTKEARIEVSLGGEPEVFAFHIDLETGVVTPA